MNWFQVVMGVLFLLLALKQWRCVLSPARKRSAQVDGDHRHLHARPIRLGARRCSRRVNPKNLALTAAAAASVAQAGLSDADSAITMAVFVVIGSLTVAGPVLFYLVASERAAGPLGSIKDFMSAHNSAIMMILLLVLGARLARAGRGGVGG